MLLKIPVGWEMQVSATTLLETSRLRGESGVAGLGLPPSLLTHLCLVFLHQMITHADSGVGL